MKIRRNARISIGHYAFMILLVPIFLSPIIFMFVSSLKPDYYQFLRDSTSLRAFLPVGNISLDNYRSAFDQAPVGRFIFNSTLVTSLTVILGLFVNSMAGFALVFLRWKGKDILLTLIMAYLSTITLPVLILFLALQRAFMESIATTGIKG